MMNGVIFDIQKFSINDGPGVRTTVFLKGCQMKCVWCHNPESLSVKKQLSFSEQKCVSCRSCAEACPNDVHFFDEAGKHHVNFDSCDACGLCIDNCLHGALKIYGKTMSVDEVFSEVIKDKIYFTKSGGGVTLSGGEAMRQFEFSLALVKKCKESGIHVCIETNGASKSEHYREIAPYVDLFLFDYKATGDDNHKELTGMTRRVVDQNLALLNKINVPVILRCPIIPNYNLSEAHLEAIARLAKQYSNIQKVEVLPYHNFGQSKAAEIGRTYKVDAKLPEEKHSAAWIEIIRSYGVVDVSLG